MAVVDIPYYRIAEAVVRPVLFSGEQGGDLGGPVLPLPRVGDRFAIDVTTARLKQEAEGRLFTAAIFEASNATARFPLRMPNRSKSYSSAIVVDGADQTGSILKLRGFGKGEHVSRGDFFSIVHNGRHFVHMAACAGSLVADADGKMELPIWPMLRFVTVDGERAAFDAPMIEGSLSGADRGAKFARNRQDPVSFSISERS